MRRIARSSKGLLPSVIIISFICLLVESVLSAVSGVGQFATSEIGTRYKTIPVHIVLLV